MMKTERNHETRRLGRRARWLSAALAVLLLSGTVMTACTGTDTPADTDVSDSATDTVGAGTNETDPTVTDPSDDPSDDPVVTDPSDDPAVTDPSDDPVVTDPADPDDPVVTDPDTPDTPGDSTVVTLPVVDTDAGDDTSGANETLPYDPELHPGDSTLYKGVMIAAVHGTGKNGAEAVIDHGFIQLYNNTDKAISLGGASLYYKTDGANPYEQFVFAEDASVPAGGYYLVRTAAPTGVAESNLIMKITAFDAEWDTHIDNKEVRLLLAPSGWSVGRDEDILAFDDAISVFYASVTPNDSVYAVDDLSRNKIAVRTAKEDYSGYHLVNLTRTATPDLENLCPVTSTGAENAVVSTRLNEVTFSHEAGIYEDTFYLELSAAEGYTVYYTTDGSDPASSSTRKKYAGKIYMSDTSLMANGPMTQAWYATGNYTVGGKVVKAYATNGTDSTPVYTNTYFVTDDLAAYGVTVMSISIPKDEMLVSNSEGFYSGYCPPGSTLTDTRPRGTGILEVFDAKGNRVGNSRVEMAVSGNGSSGGGMKSLRIYYKSALQYNIGTETDPANPDYPAYESAGTQSALHYDLFGGLAKNANGEAITSFSRILLRNSGNDCGNSYIRDAYMQRTGAGLNVDIMAAASTLVFVNGEFWGVYNARERYSPEYVESHYGIQKENVAIIENDYYALTQQSNPNANFVLSSGLEGDEDDFNELIAYMRPREGSLSDADYEYICSKMDVDSFIDMWIVRLFYVAHDWPENNIKVWRNRNPDDPSGFDTKWHFTLLDMDMGLSFYDFTTESNTDMWRLAFDSGSTTGMMMRCLMSNQTFKETFLVRFYDVVQNHLTADYLLSELEAYIAERDPLMELQTKRWAGDGASISTWDSACSRMRSFVTNRQSIVMQQFYSRYGITEDDILNMGEQRVTVTYNTNRVTLTVNGEVAENGTVYKFEKGDTVTFTVSATVKDGYLITGILFADRAGNVQKLDTAQGTFTVTATGTITVQTKRIDTGEPAGGTLVAGATYLFYLTPEGDLYAWGDNRLGVLGLGYEGGTVSTPTYVMSGVAKVVTSAANAYENGDITFSTAILTTDGRVLTVGANTCGQLGRNGKNNSSALGEIEFDGKIKDVSVGHDHLLILDENGVLWGIGSNSHGALGSTGVGGDVSTFTQLATDVVAMSAGRRSTVYLTEDGQLWGVGDNRWKKMSQSHGDQIHSPVVIASGIAFVDSGEHEILAIDESGKLYYAGWRTVQGFNQGGGNNPTFATVMNSGVVKADIYFANAVILTDAGDAYVYGLNTENGIGAAAVTNGTPQKILSDVVDVAAGYGFTAYLMEDGRILIQGNNTFGQAGNGTTGGTVSLVEANY